MDVIKKNDRRHVRLFVRPLDSSRNKVIHFISTFTPKMIPGIKILFFMSRVKETKDKVEYLEIRPLVRKPSNYGIYLPLPR